MCFELLMFVWFLLLFCFIFLQKLSKQNRNVPLLHLPTPPLAKQQTTMNTHKKTKEEEESLSPKNACSKGAKGNHSFERKRTGKGGGKEKGGMEELWHGPATSVTMA